MLPPYWMPKNIVKFFESNVSQYYTAIGDKEHHCKQIWNSWCKYCKLLRS